MHLPWKRFVQKALILSLKILLLPESLYSGSASGCSLCLTSQKREASESGNIKGLGLIPGSVKKFPSDKTVDQGLKVPQIGWNKLTDVTGSLLREEDYVYFVHSFYCDPKDPKDAAAYTTYGIKYACALEKDNIFATQFHPEKSGEAGLQILERFSGRIRK